MKETDSFGCDIIYNIDHQNVNNVKAETFQLITKTIYTFCATADKHLVCLP